LGEMRTKMMESAPHHCICFGRMGVLLIIRDA
jgi:hypothetical protein